MSDIGLVTPLLRDEQFFDPVTGRGTLRFLQYLEEIRASANATTTIINQEVEAFTLQTQQVQTFTKVLEDQIENVRALAVIVSNLQSAVNELSKRLDDVEQLANGH